MPRGKRIILNNAYYHLINRGNQKQNTFLENSDFEKYLELLTHYKRKYKIKLFGYCLMPNHMHLVVVPKKAAELAKFMQGLTQTYTFWFNQKYDKNGRLWQGRFKSMVIQDTAYFLECVSYIEANPVRAGLTSSPADYLWSSYRDRVFGNKNEILDLPDST